jgi:lantibiotic modifying enzyme
MKNIEDKLSQISQYLMLYVNTIDNVGLINGKMGILLFFYHYSKYIDKTIYRDFARELLNDIYEDINIDVPINFADGFCGIGWGFLHLIEEHFVEANADEILSEIDMYIMEKDIRKNTDTTLYTGLAGIAQYVIQRKNMDQMFIQELIKNMDSKGYVNEEFEFLKTRLKEIFYRKTQEISYSTRSFLQKMVATSPTALNDLPHAKYDLGISNIGLSGIGLNLILNVYGKI